MVDNIFSSLMYKKTTGAVLEFVLWCGVCFAALMAMAAFALGKGNVTWILLMLFSIGLGFLPEGDCHYLQHLCILCD